MGILNYVPEFSVVEPNRLTALITGQVLSQFETTDSDIITTTSAGVDVVENGVILGLNDDLTLGAYSAEDINNDNPADASHAQPFLHYTEEIVTFLSGNKYFAAEEDPDEEIYPRGLALYVGDSFTTDNYTESLPDENLNDPAGATTVALADAAFATVIDGQIVLQEDADENGYKSIFAAVASTLPTGEDAVRVTYLGQ